MKKFACALVGAASIALASCGGGNDDSLNNADALGNTANLDALATDAANDAEAEALGNQAAQLNEEGAANAVDELNAAGTSENEENVSGM
ncbi:MAG TPA: hypothetical protein VE403_04615 [Sphingomicrobium sp.]|nr:hypothetical protein [Sphingomicrobium sp.]